MTTSVGTSENGADRGVEPLQPPPRGQTANHGSIHLGLVGDDSTKKLGEERLVGAGQGESLNVTLKAMV